MTALADGWLALAVALVVLLVFVVGVAASRRGQPRVASDEQMHAVETRLAEVEHDVRNMRMSLHGLATKDAVNDVKVQVAALTGELKAVTTTTSSMHRSLERVEGFLMEAAAKRIAEGSNG